MRTALRRMFLNRNYMNNACVRNLRFKKFNLKKRTARGEIFRVFLYKSMRFFPNAFALSPHRYIHSCFLNCLSTPENFSVRFKDSRWSPRPARRDGLIVKIGERLVLDPEDIEARLCRTLESRQRWICGSIRRDYLPTKFPYIRDDFRNYSRRRSPTDLPILSSLHAFGIFYCLWVQISPLFVFMLRTGVIRHYDLNTWYILLH